MPVKTLMHLSIGETRLIQSLHQEEHIKKRLMDLGFIAGMPVTLALISPFGNPRAYRIAGSMIALRNSDAEKISVTEEGGEQL